MMSERFQKASRWFSVAAVAGMLCLPAQSFAGYTLSRDIVPADGTTGQSVTTGSGIKTGHIQNGAVTSLKIAAGAVTVTQIADGAVTNSKIADGSVTDAKLGLGAVTDAKISGPISPSKIGAYAGVKTVHKGAADNVNTFSTIVDALKALEGATGRNAIFVMPGIYEEDFSSYIKNGETRNVEIIGAGRNTTTIKAIGAPDGWRGYPYLYVPSGLTLRNLTFQGLLAITEGCHDVRLEDLLIQQGIGVYIYGSFANIAIEHVSIESTEIGLLFFIATGSSTLTLKDLEITAPNAEAAHVRNGDGAPVRFYNTRITAGAGIETNGYVEINNSVITADTPLYAENIYGQTPLIAVKNSEINGTSLSTNPGKIAIDNSVISAVPINGNAMISNSKIVNTVGTYGNMVKIVNSANANYDPIPNGLY